MRARKTESEIRREQIVQAALDLIGDQGLSSLSIAAIAERVGIVPSALYRHFKSKDEVLDAVLELLRSRLLANVAQARKETPEALQRLRRLLVRQVRLLSENRAIPQVVFSDGIYTGHAERKAKVAQMITAYLGRIQEILEEGKQEGTIRQDVVPSTASLMFLGLILPAAVLSNISEGRFDLIAHAESAWPTFARCIAARR
ncbi:MAG TPA: TetR/AcrR family transcriptional regulator [Firmicutes bacterium]|mgnify:CR=1 FL=1|nr:TetR/AcrR family transcriptional regulator [Bacillota bacterium]